MIVTITNVSSAQQYVSCLVKSLEPSEIATWTGSQSELDAQSQLKQLAADGLVTYVVSAGTDNVDIRELTPTTFVSYTNDLRPLPNTVPPGTGIWNTDDKAPNWSDGTNWRDSVGVIT